MQNPLCESKIFIEGFPIACDLNTGHGTLHSHTDVEDCSSDKEGTIKRQYADVVFLWVEKVAVDPAQLTKSEKGEAAQETIAITVICPTCQKERLVETVRGDGTRYSYCPACTELNRHKMPDWIQSGRHG